jgi:hypothetical protein
MIHEERGKLLRELPRGADVFCSAGCAGRWYFDWVEEQYGPVKLHYGVELYSPRPDDLPPNVRWIQNSVADMKDVPNAAVDLLFSGQNIEHLYREDLVGFLREASRVVKDGGYICLDSPNRLITEEAGYTHPQHTLEFSVEEALTFIEAAGFVAETVRGIWSCTNGLRRYEDLTSLIDDVERRRQDGIDDPNASFIWWIVARKVQSARPDLDQFVDTVLLRSFPPFVAARFRSSGRELDSFEGTDVILRVAPADQGFVFYGPYVPLRAGEWQASADVKFLGPSGTLKMDVASQYGNKVHREMDISPSAIGSWQNIVLPFDLAEYTEGVETRLMTNGADAQIRFGSKILRR